jgi:hypothetical protein
MARFLPASPLIVVPLSGILTASRNASQFEPGHSLSTGQIMAHRRVEPWQPFVPAGKILLAVETVFCAPITGR